MLPDIYAVNYVFKTPAYYPPTMYNMLNENLNLKFQVHIRAFKGEAEYACLENDILLFQK